MTQGLVATGLSRRFGGNQAVREVSLRVPPGTVVGLIGPNGSGKTTTLNLLNGVLRPDAGDISVDGAALAGRSSRNFVDHGITRTFQTTRVFTTITAMENLLIPTLHDRGPRAELRRRAVELLEFVGLSLHRDTAASELSGGQQKLLEFVRALMTEPKAILMDEPFAGVHPSLKETMRESIRQRNEQGTSFVVVSHEIPDLMRLCDEVVCMSDGAVICHGTPQEVTEDPRVIEAYLGAQGAAGSVP